MHGWRREGYVHAFAWEKRKPTTHARGHAEKKEGVGLACANGKKKGEPVGLPCWYRM